MYLMMTSAKVLKSAVIVITVNSSPVDMNALAEMSRLCDMVCLQRKHPQFGFTTKMRSRILIQ